MQLGPSPGDALHRYHTAQRAAQNNATPHLLVCASESSLSVIKLALPSARHICSKAPGVCVCVF
jgi:hypothetical protein